MPTPNITPVPPGSLLDLQLRLELCNRSIELGKRRGIPWEHMIDTQRELNRRIEAKRAELGHVKPAPTIVHMKPAGAGGKAVKPS